MKKIIFYGDSNTYGYDPRGFPGMRYSEKIRWTSMVQEHFKGEYTIIEEGQNGRQLPSLPREEGFLKELTGQLSEGDLLIMMLGTNDILLTDHPNADTAIKKMERLLEWLMERNPGYQIIVVGPVPISIPSTDMRKCFDECIRMNEGFQSICKARGIAWYNSLHWNIPLAYDGVHFSEDGCIQFASHIIDMITQVGCGFLT